MCERGAYRSSKPLASTFECVACKNVSCSLGSVRATCSGSEWTDAPCLCRSDVPNVADPGTPPSCTVHCDRDGTGVLSRKSILDVYDSPTSEVLPVYTAPLATLGTLAAAAAKCALPASAPSALKHLALVKPYYNALLAATAVVWFVPERTHAVFQATFTRDAPAATTCSVVIGDPATPAAECSLASSSSACENTNPARPFLRDPAATAQVACSRLHARLRTHQYVSIHQCILLRIH